MSVFLSVYSYVFFFVHSVKWFIMNLTPNLQAVKLAQTKRGADFLGKWKWRQLLSCPLDPMQACWFAGVHSDGWMGLICCIHHAC